MFRTSNPERNYCLSQNVMLTLHLSLLLSLISLQSLLLLTLFKRISQPVARDAPPYNLAKSYVGAPLESWRPTSGNPGSNTDSCYLSQIAVDNNINMEEKLGQNYILDFELHRECRRKTSSIVKFCRWQHQLLPVVLYCTKIICMEYQLVQWISI